jgi:sulfite exporter TauE/SafE
MDGILRLQLLMSALAALFLLLFGLNRLGILPEPAWLAAADFQKIPILGRLVRRSMQTTQLLSVFTLGLMLGLLPCGLSYAAFARALASGSSLSGGLLVLCFGIGTLPGLLLLGTSAGLLLKRHRRLTEILAGLIMVAMALLLARDISTTLF